MTGMPTYVLAGEFATAEALAGELPDALRDSAPEDWERVAARALEVAEGLAARGDVAEAAEASFGQCFAAIPPRSQCEGNCGSEAGQCLFDRPIQRCELRAEPNLDASSLWVTDLFLQIANHSSRSRPSYRHPVKRHL